MKIPPTRIIGAHISASGGLGSLLKNAEALGPCARCFAFFIRPRMTWRKFPPFSSEIVSEFREKLELNEQFCLAHLAVHGSYLVNLASHNAELRAKSVDLMTEEVSKCEQLGIPYYVFHPSSCTEHTIVKSKKRLKCEEDIRIEENRKKNLRIQSKKYVAESMMQVLSKTSHVALVLENTAGQGNCLGADLTELREVLDSIEMLWQENGCGSAPYQRLGICLDTCHLFASGTCIVKDGGDLFVETSMSVYEELWNFIANSLGARWMNRNVLKVVHLNDSKAPAASRKDQHANIGKGCMPIEFFYWMMQSEHFENIPMILETPRKKANKKRKSKTAKDKVYEIEPLSAKEEIELLTGWVGK